MPRKAFTSTIASALLVVGACGCAGGTAGAVRIAPGLVDALSSWPRPEHFEGGSRKERLSHQMKRRLRLSFPASTRKRRPDRCTKDYADYRCRNPRSRRGNHRRSISFLPSLPEFTTHRCAPGRTRTDTVLILSQLPLPLGYGGCVRINATNGPSRPGTGPIRRGCRAPR